MEQNTVYGINAENFVIRGNFALEDRNFQKAEQFFEQALNIDAKCAEAYLGNFLVEVQCSSLDEYIRLRLQETAPSVPAPQPMQQNTHHIEEMAEKYAVGPHFTKDVIRAMYQQEFRYNSCVPQRQAQRKQEEARWSNHPLLSRSERLAAGAFAQKLTQAKMELFEQLDQRIVDAKTEDMANQQMQRIAYEDFLRITDRQVVQANDAALCQDYAQIEFLLSGKNKDRQTLAQQYQRRFEAEIDAHEDTKKQETSPKLSDKTLVTTAIILLLAIAAIVVFITLSFFGSFADKPGQDPGEINVTTEAAGSCTRIEVSSYEIDIPEGAAYQLNVVKEPADTTDEVIFTSSDPNIATVDQYGNITPVNTGTVIIIITCGDQKIEVSVSCKV